MAFSTLFSTLATAEDLGSPPQPPPPHRTTCSREPHTDTKGHKFGSQQTGHHNSRKRQCNQAKRTEAHRPPASYRDHGSKAGGFPAAMDDLNCPRDSLSHDRDARIPNNADREVQRGKNRKKRQQQKRKWNENLQHQNDNRAPGNRGGRHPGGTRCSSYRGRGGGSNRGTRQNPEVKRSRYMTQEFKDQNVLEVDGRLLCLHFLKGRCIKGEECQLEHLQSEGSLHGLIKAVCKFYVQGFCDKGERCIYMHNSFPCKFFHTRGKCSQGAECRFSHEPLTDLTKQLLDQAIQRDDHYKEIAKKAQQVDSGQLEKSDELITSEEKVPDLLLLPIRPNFYNSSCPTEPLAEKETFLCETGESTRTERDTVPQHVAAPSSHLNCHEPVPYSVEAVLGPTKLKPFPSLYSTLTSDQSATSSSPQCASDCSSNATNQRDAPYSVDAVLGSVKAVGNVSLSHRTGPMPFSYSASSNLAANFDSDKDLKPFSDSPDHKETVLCSENRVIESSEPTEKKTKLKIPHCQGTPVLTVLPSTSYKDEGGFTSHLENPAKRQFSGKVKTGQLPFPSSALEKSRCSKTKEETRGGSVVSTSGHLARDQTASQDPTQSLKVCDPVIDSENHKCKGGPPAQPPKSLQKTFHNLFVSPLVPLSPQHSELSPETSFNITDHQGKIDVPAEPPRLFASLFASPLTHNSAPKQSSQLRSRCAGQTKPDCESKQPHDAGSGSNKPMKRLFQNPDSISTPSFQEAALSSSTSIEHVKADKGVLCSLFSIPINEATASLASPPCKPESTTALLADGTGKKCTEASSPDFRPGPNRKKRKRSQNVRETSAGQDSKRRQRQPSGVLSEKASSETTRTNSVLKNLFLHLSPYCHEGVQQHSSIQGSFSESGTPGNIGLGPREEVGKRIEHQLKKEVMMPEESAEPFSPHLQGSTKPSNPLTAAGPDISKSHIPARFSQGPARTRGVHRLPITAVMQTPRCRPTPGHGPGQKEGLDGKVGSTSLKNLFKALDVTASPFGP